MTDETSGPTPSAAPSGGTDKGPADKGPAAPQVPLAIVAQYVKDLSFENPRAPGIFGSATPPQSAASVTVQTRHLGERAYEVLLNMRIEGTIAGEPAYIVELSYGGVFAIGPVPNEVIEPLLMVEAPRLLFPFARSVAAAATREGGFPQILVNPIDFAAMYRGRRQQAGAGAAVAAGAPAAGPATGNGAA